MASWRKPDPGLVEAFHAALPLTQGVERRQMFGCPCASVHGHMFAGVHEGRLIVRIPSEAAARPFAPMGRAMKEYAAIEDALDCDAQEIKAWIARALAYTRTLPPKPAKAAKTAKTGTAAKTAKTATSAKTAKTPARRPAR